jgi:two-component system CheB/CheR fusion protein
MDESKIVEELNNELAELRMQLEEARETIDAIRTGQADALIIMGDDGHQLYTLKSADQTYRVFIEKMSEGAVTINHAGIVLYSNSSFASMMNVPLEKLIGTAFESFVDHYSLPKFSALIAKGWESDFKDEIFLKSADDRQICCLISCNTLDMDGGMALSLIITDLTNQKDNLLQLELQNDELEQAHNYVNRLNDELEDIIKERSRELLVSREHLKLLSDHIPQMTWTNLPGGERNFFNQQWHEYTGLTFDESKDWGWQRALHPDDLVDTNRKYFEALSSGEVFEMENRYRRNDGSYRWHLNRAVPLKSDDKEILFWVGTATDIEDQKKEMEKKDEFIGVASHELKTPLTSLKGYLQLLMAFNAEAMPPVAINYLTKANIAINKLQYLVNDLLDVSKIQAGRLDYVMAPVSIISIVNDTVENARHIYPAFNFERQIDADVMVNGNGERLEQVLMNFINNAVKYAKGNKNVIVKAALHNGRYVRTSVTDFGIGLSAPETERVFDRFYRVEDKKYMTSGLGMGLFIATEIVNAHRGKIGVESEPGQGATFYFDLDVVEPSR